MSWRSYREQNASNYRGYAIFDPARPMNEPTRENLRMMLREAAANTARAQDVVNEGESLTVRVHRE